LLRSTQFTGAPLKHYPPVPHGVCPVGDSQSQLGVLLNEQHTTTPQGTAGADQIPHPLKQMFGQRRRQAHAWLVKQEESGARSQCTAQSDHLLLPTAERASGLFESWLEMREEINHRAYP